MIHFGCDFYNPCIAERTLHHHRTPKKDQSDLNRKLHGRMPWHDVHSAVTGSAAHDVAMHFIGRWNNHQRERTVAVEMQEQDTATKLAQKNLTCKCKMGSSIANAERLLPYPNIAIPSPPSLPTELPGCHLEGLGFECEAQVLRSGGMWSLGLDFEGGANAQAYEAETSILEAYLHHIKHAEHHIYIENQFFISSLGHTSASGAGAIHNRIAEAIANRIVKAIEEKTNFKVVIMLPNYPEGDPSAPATQYIMCHQRNTLCRRSYPHT